MCLLLEIKNGQNWALVNFLDMYMILCVIIINMICGLCVNFLSFLGQSHSACMHDTSKQVLV